MSIDYYLKEAWKAIEESYYSGEICSERHMQAELFHRLYCSGNFRAEFKLFVEPAISFKTGNKGRIIPDMLITRERSIVAVVELKYNPMAYIPYQKDMSTFWEFYKQKGSNETISLLTDSQTGNYKEAEEFTISQELLLVYAAIANKFSDAITKKEEIWTDPEELNHTMSNYLYMTGSIYSPERPEFGVFSKLDYRV